MFGHRKKALLPSEDPTSIGNLILKEGLLTESTLRELVEEFQSSDCDTLLGTFLVSKGVLTEEKLQIVLLKQRAARNGGVEHEHVMEAMKLAQSTETRMTVQLDRLVTATASAATKVGAK